MTPQPEVAKTAEQTPAPAPAKKPASAKQLAARERFRQYGKAIHEAAMREKAAKGATPTALPASSPKEAKVLPPPPPARKQAPAPGSAPEVPTVKAVTRWFDHIGLKGLPKMEFNLDLGGKK
jgi:hypothetical protein